MSGRNFVPIYGLFKALLQYKDTCEAYSRRTEAVRMGFKKSSDIWPALEETDVAASHLIVSVWATLLELWVLYAIRYYFV